MIYIGSDHNGLATKEAIKKQLSTSVLQFTDLGTNSENSVDYPDVAKNLASLVIKNKERGILICGSGNGMAIAANKIKGIRAAVAWDSYTAKKARLDNDANVLCLSGKNTNIQQAVEIAKIWLKTQFSGQLRHQRRIKKINALEEYFFKK